MLRAGLCKLGGHSAGRGPSCCTENHCVADANGLMRANTFPAPRTRSSVPLVRAELDNGEQLIVGDLVHPVKVPRGLLRLGHAGGRRGNAGFEQRAAHIGDVDDSDEAFVADDRQVERQDNAGSLAGACA